MEAKRAARKKVTELTRRFFEDLTRRLAGGTSVLWHRVEQRLAQKPPTAEAEYARGPAVPGTATQQQPVQQPQGSLLPGEPPSCAGCGRTMRLADRDTVGEAGSLTFTCDCGQVVTRQGQR